MLTKQKPSSPKRVRVIEEVKHGVLSGELAPGERLATVREMSAHFCVSLSVVQNAMKELMNDGFVECRGSSGFYVSGQTQAAEKSAAPAVRPDGGRLFFAFEHHSDLVWLRTFGEYEKIREEQLLALFRYAKKYPQTVFGFEQAEVARIFLEKHPEFVAEAKQLVGEGRLELYGEFCIPDLNMICGESIFRNLEAGRAYWRKTLGAETDSACFFDAFGMCAQLPQILALCGIRHLVPGRTPNEPEEIADSPVFRWRSPDGTSGVSVIRQQAFITHLGYDFNVPMVQSEDSHLAKGVLAAKNLPGNARVVYMTEETPLRESIFAILAEANRTGGKPLRFGSIAEFARTVPENLPEYSGEFNPTFTGCYTTRIEVKQTIRRLENRLFACEFLNAVSGGSRSFDGEWNSLMLTQFHDAVCGCHTDPVNAEIQALFAGTVRRTELTAGHIAVSLNNVRGLQKAEAGFVPEGVPCQADGKKFIFLAELPPCGAKRLPESRRVPAAEKPCAPVFRTRYFSADFTSADPKIRNLEGENVFPESGFGEILFRRDAGSMWTEKFFTGQRGREFQKERIVSCTSGEVFFRIVTEGEVLPSAPEAGNEGSHWSGFGSLHFRKEYRFWRELDYFTLKLTLDWHGNDTKISIRFPVQIRIPDSCATFETPCGSAVRKPYFEVPEEYAATSGPLAADSDYASACGDWPALNWVNLSDYTKGLTAANSGTPGFLAVGGNLIAGLIRSGTATADGGARPQEGAFDNGVHEYEFAFRAHSPGEMEKAYELGVLLNRPPVCVNSALPEGSFLNWDSPNLALSCVRKQPEGVLVRLYETLGTESSSRLSGALTEGRELWLASPFGEPKTKIPDERIVFRPFEIKTLLAR